MCNRLVLLAGVIVLMVERPARADDAPGFVHAYAGGPKVMVINWECADASSCPATFSIYRTPPGTGKVLIVHMTQSPVEVQSELDYTVAPRTSYVYQVCAGDAANAQQDNCTKTTPISTPPEQMPGNGSGPPPPSQQHLPPPVNLRAMSVTGVALAWTNPPDVHSPIFISRSLYGSDPRMHQLPAGTGRWIDTETDSHLHYTYNVCEGVPILAGAVDINCALVSATTWGPPPAMRAGRVAPTKVSIRVAMDNVFADHLVITRQGADDACRQPILIGGKLACPDPNISGTAQSHIVYEGPSNPGTCPSCPPGVADFSDDTIKSDVEYYYLTCATWPGLPEQCSEVVTVPIKTTLGTKMVWVASSTPGERQIIRNESKKAVGLSYKGALVAPAPVRPADKKLAVTSVNPAVGMDGALSAVRARPNDPGALFDLARAHIASGARQVGRSELWMALIVAENHHVDALIPKINAELALNK